VGDSIVDALFGDERLAVLYDLMEHDRDDLLPYVDLVVERGARSVVDLGCGTGTFACLLAERKLRVIGVDPAMASLAIARRKPGAEHVQWIAGDATALGSLRADAVTMTGNVAQVFTSDDTWLTTLRACRKVLDDSGSLIFETRDPARAAWSEWNREATMRAMRLPEGDRLTTWVELVSVDLPLVSFRQVFSFDDRAETLVSDSTLRFRSLDEIADTLSVSAFDLQEVRDAPDRPGREFVILAAPA
jgi:ubiquinone/menaquinone biosynthesis C-methylase UbiE